MVSDRLVRRTRLVLSSDAAAPGASTREARLCEVGSLDAAKVEDDIVVCDRGVTARVDKSTAVAAAGGAGMVLANTAPGAVDADMHAVPTVQLDVRAARSVMSYLRRAGRQATAALVPLGAEPAPAHVAGFSARGRVPAAATDLVKPDLVAPGVSVLGAVAPPSDSGRMWDLSSGTSMSAPYAAGLAASVLGAHPRWSAARVRSALMTTADPVGSPLSAGAGLVARHKLLDPGLVYDATPGAWRGYAGGRVGSGSLNQPAIAVAGLTGRRSVVREVTSVARRTETYRATVTGLHGVEATVRPAAVTLGPGETARFTVRFRSTSAAPTGGSTSGFLTWTGPAHRARIPLVVAPVSITAPAEVSGSRASGALVVHGNTGTGEPVRLHATGLVPSAPIGLSLEPGPFDPGAPAPDTDTFTVPVQVPPGTQVARFRMEAHNRGDDVDVFVYRNGRMVGRSATASGDETVTLPDPAAGRYDVYVNAVAAENGSTITGQLYTWVVGAGAAGNLRLDRHAVSAGVGDVYRFRARWDGLDLTRRWLGVVRYGRTGVRTLVGVR
jgi:hypothetical protein